MVLDVDNIFPTVPAEDEFFRGTLDKGVYFYYVGGDFVYGELEGSTTETEVSDYDIPSGTVINGIRVTVIGSIVATTGDSNEGTVKIKAGTNGSEALYTKFESNRLYANAMSYITVAIIDDLDWDKPQTVSVTADNDDSSGGNLTSVSQMFIEGF